jgi:hypothetical protein
VESKILSKTFDNPKTQQNQKQAVAPSIKNIHKHSKANKINQLNSPKRLTHKRGLKHERFQNKSPKSEKQSFASQAPLHLSPPFLSSNR